MMQVLLWLAATCYMVGIWWLSSKGPELTARVDATGVPDFYSHLVLYAGLSFLLRLALWSTWSGRSELRLGGMAAAGALGYGLIDELHQRMVPGRGTDTEDLLGNLAGAGAAQLLVAIALRLYRLF